MTSVASRAWSSLFVIGAAVVYVFLYAPLVVTAVFSFNNSDIQTLPFSGFTTVWYEDLANDVQMREALLYSFKVAALSVALAATLGTVLALILDRVAIRGKGVLSAAVVVPAVLPGMVLALSLLMMFRYIGVSPGFTTIVVGHMSFIAPIVMFLILSRLRQLDPSLEQASMDCGAGRLRTFWHVTLPSIRVTVIAACLLGFTLSFDEITVTFFLSGVQPTLPVHVWTLLRFGFTPEVNAVFTLIAAVSLVLIVLAAVLLSGWRPHRRNAPTSAPPIEQPAQTNVLALTYERTP